MTRKAIILWAWKDAPEHYRKFSDNGGEDWVALVSPGACPHVVDTLRRMAVCDCQEVELTSGDTLLIGSHA